MNNIRITPCKVVLDRNDAKIEPSTPKEQLALSAELREVINVRNVLTGRTKKKFMNALQWTDEKYWDASLHDKRKNMLVQELLETELVYLKQLERIQTYFMKPIRERKLLKYHEYETIFGSIDLIYKVNGELVNELKQDLMHITSVFTKMAPYFKHYSVYAVKYKDALETLQRLLNDEKFSKFLQNQESRPEVQNKLSSLLITPIQRIPRYCLLVKQILDETNENTSEYNKLQESYKKIEEVARHLNSLVDEREKAQRQLELMRCIKDGKSLVIHPGRRLIKEGVMKLYEKNKSKEVYLILFTDIIMRCDIVKRKNLNQPNALKCTTIFPLNKCQVSHNTTSSMMMLKCEKDNMELYSNAGHKTNEWVTEVEEAISECVSNRLTLRTGSASRQPGVRFNFEKYSDHGLSPGHKLRKKRRLEDMDQSDLENMDRGKLFKSDSKVSRKDKFKSLLPLPLPALRRSILKKQVKVEAKTEDNDACSHASPPKTEEKKDSLFPLREQVQQQGTSFSSVTSTTPGLQPCSNGEVDVYVFGRNENCGFSFGGILTGISNSFKKVFGLNCKN